MFNKKADTIDKKIATREPLKSGGPAVGKSGKSTEMAVVGRSIIIKGEVTGQEDILVEGTIEGKIDLENQHVIIGPSGTVQAEVKARLVTIEGQVTGNIEAGERVVITEQGSLTGDIQADRLSVEDGAYLKGTVTLSPRKTEKPLSLAANKPADKPTVKESPGK